MTLYSTSHWEHVGTWHFGDAVSAPPFWAPPSRCWPFRRWDISTPAFWRRTFRCGTERWQVSDHVHLLHPSRMPDGTLVWSAGALWTQQGVRRVSKEKANCPQTSALNFFTPTHPLCGYICLIRRCSLSTADCTTTADTVVAGQRRALGGGQRLHERWEVGSGVMDLPSVVPVRRAGVEGELE